MDSLLAAGPAFGYFAEPAKSFLVVKLVHQVRAVELFGDLKVEVTSSNRFLSDCVGDEELCR